MIKLNEKTKWEIQFDDSIQVGDHIECHHSQNGKTRGFWRVMERVEKVIRTKDDVDRYRKYDYSNKQYVEPPYGMLVDIELKLMRVMMDDFEEPYRRDTTVAGIKYCVKITQEYYDGLRARYDHHLNNLAQLMNGSWVV